MEKTNKVFAKIEPVPKQLWKKKAIISYSYFSSPFGKMVVASMPRGVCYVGYALTTNVALKELHERFPFAVFRIKKNKNHEKVKRFFNGKWEKCKKIPLFLKGTDFQMNIWQALLQIPTGTLSTYTKIAEQVGCPKAQRAVGTAIGRNPILLIVPCHRVIAQNGKMGGFYWGIDKKIELLNAENAGFLRLS